MFLKSMKQYSLSTSVMQNLEFHFKFYMKFTLDSENC